MLNIKLKNLFWTTAALFCAMQFCYAQAPGPAVENTSAASTALINIGPSSDSSATASDAAKPAPYQAEADHRPSSVPPRKRPGRR